MLRQRPPIRGTPAPMSLHAGMMPLGPLLRQTRQAIILRSANAGKMGRPARSSPCGDLSNTPSPDTGLLPRRIVSRYPPRMEDASVARSALTPASARRTSAHVVFRLFSYLRIASQIRVVSPSRKQYWIVYLMSATQIRISNQCVHTVTGTGMPKSRERGRQWYPEVGPNVRQSYMRRMREDSVPTTAIIAAAVPPMIMSAAGAERRSASPPPPVDPSGIRPRSRL